MLSIHTESRLPAVLGEIIEATTLRFVAQCLRDRLHEPPDFGAFVKVVPHTALSDTQAAVAETETYDPFAEPEAVPAATLPVGTGDGTIYAVVCYAATGSAEPGRRASAYGLNEDRLREEQPQIFDLLSTEFAALPLGYAEGGRIRPHLPPRPPRLHAFVEACTDDEICALADAPDFVRTLLAAPAETGGDELIAACLRRAANCQKQPFPFLVRLGKQLANLLREDPERLAALLRKMEP